MIVDEYAHKGLPDEKLTVFELACCCFLVDVLGWKEQRSL